MVMSLSKTLKGLHWDKIPGDNDGEVAARGILYLLIFQQLGQLVRWSWGYNVLLKKKSEYTEAELGEEEEQSQEAQLERGDYSESSTVNGENEPLLIGVPYSDDPLPGKTISSGTPSDTEFESGSSTPIPRKPYLSDSDVISNGHANGSQEAILDPAGYPDPDSIANQHQTFRQESTNHINTFPSIEDEYVPPGPKRWLRRVSRSFKSAWTFVSTRVTCAASRTFNALPNPLQFVLRKVGFGLFKVFQAVWANMNPPLWAMLVALIVASVPKLQEVFFTPGSFIENSVTRAVKQSGGVAVPLILVVLGANLARNTLPQDELSNEDPKVEKKLLIASLVSRMLLPTIIMTPILAVIAKFVPVSILDDPIFVIVCFLLVGAPSALQLAQICQINNVFMVAMSNLLFQSYVIW